MAASIALSGKYIIKIIDPNGQPVETMVKENDVLYVGIGKRFEGLTNVELALGEDNEPTDVETHTSVLTPLKYVVTSSKDNEPTFEIGRALELTGSTTFEVDILDDSMLGEVSIVGFSRTSFPTKRFIPVGSKLSVTYEFTLSYEMNDTPFEYKDTVYECETLYRIDETRYKDYKWYSLLKGYGYFNLVGLSRPVDTLTNISRAEPFAQKDIEIYDRYYLAANVTFTGDDPVTFNGFESGTPIFGITTHPYNLLTEDGDVIPLNLTLENSQRIGVVELLSTSLGG